MSSSYEIARERARQLNKDSPWQEAPRVSRDTTAKTRHKPLQKQPKKISA